jgi:FHA domain
MDRPLLPQHLLLAAHRLERDDFVDQFEDEHLLLVGLVADQRDAMIDALEAHPTERGRTWTVREGDTGGGTGVGAVTLTDVKERLASIPPPFDGDGLAWLLSDPHYALPLRKRVGATVGDADQISIGRSRANDIVLNHRSVSKRHALLECDELDRFYISDLSSTNFTKVRGRIVEPSQMGNFTPGEEIFLGDVPLRIVGADTLWDALHSNE